MLVPLNPEELHGIEHAAEQAIHSSSCTVGPARTPEEQLTEDLASLPSWRRQITGRGLVISVLLSFVFTIVILKLTLSAGVVPSLNIAGGLLGFCCLRMWSAGATALGLTSGRLTPQETNVVQTFVTAASSVASMGGFGSFLCAMDNQTFTNLGGATAFNRVEDVLQPELGRTMPYLLTTCVIGVFMLVLLRKLLIIDWGLIFPSGTATGLMITSFHTGVGEAVAQAQLAVLGRSFVASFAWAGMKWFTTKNTCSFCLPQPQPPPLPPMSPPAGTCGGPTAFPLFGQRALKFTWNFDWQLQLVGAGMICPHIVNISMVLGALLSWGYLWPLVQSKEGTWYAAGLGEFSLEGFAGYKIFSAVALLSGDGLYQVVKILFMSIKYIAVQLRPRRSPAADDPTTTTPGQPGSGSSRPGDNATLPNKAALLEKGSSTDDDNDDCDDLRRRWDSGRDAAAAVGNEGREFEYHELPEEQRMRTAVFLKQTIPSWVSLLGYVAFSVLGMAVIPRLYPQVRWFHVLTGYILAPVAALPNSVGCGLTDWDMSATYGKVAIVAFAAWAGTEGGGVMVGLVMCGVMLAASSAASTLMQDFRTGYITMSAPIAMFVVQLMGSLLGVVMAPLAFLLFWGTGKVGVPGGPFPVPMADVYRSMAIFGTRGFHMLPLHCDLFMYAFFALGIALHLVRDFVVPQRYKGWVPSGMAMSLPTYIGAQLAVAMGLGSAITAVWEYVDPVGALLLAPALASGLIVGDGVWAVPSSMLSVFGIQPPVCLGTGGFGLS